MTGATVRQEHACAGSSSWPAARPERPQHPALALARRRPRPRAVRRPDPPAHRRRPRRTQPGDQLRRRPAPRRRSRPRARLGAEVQPAPGPRRPDLLATLDAVRRPGPRTTPRSGSTPSTSAAPTGGGSRRGRCPTSGSPHLRRGRLGLGGPRRARSSTSSERFRAELLLDRADRRAGRRPRCADEQAQWIDRGAVDGVPVRGAPRPADVSTPGGRAASPPASWRTIERPEVEASDGLIVMCSAEDDPEHLAADRSRASAPCGSTATTEGLSVVPLSQVIEVAETRGPAADVLGGLAPAAAPGAHRLAGDQPRASSRTLPAGRVDEVLELA